MQTLPRRTLLTGALAAPFVISARAAETLVVTAYGGEYQEVFTKTVLQPFEQKFGVHIIYDQSGGAAQTYAKIRAARGAPGFDVAAELTAPEAILGGREKLLEPVSEREVPNLKYVWQKSLTAIPPVGVIPYYQYTPLLWNKHKIDKPDSWADYWMPGAKYGDKIKGHLLGHDPGSNVLEVYALIMAAKLKGGGVDDMAGAWELLKQQKPYLGPVIQTSAQAAPYFENEEVWLTPYWSARSGYYVAKGYPFGFTIPKEGTIGLVDVSSVPVGAANKKLAFEFLNFRLDRDVQRAFCLGYFASPGRPDITDWPAEFAENQIVTEQKMAALDLPDSAVIGRMRNAWVMQWQEIMAS
ncbi:MAG: extracellular solute-binding protein [Acidisphaera sp.]|nr:extracellular solute-binding protein [Acidisphaera sp.]